jgi:putative hemolysin
MTRAIKWWLTLSGCASVYHEAQRTTDTPFDERILRALNVSVDAQALTAIPTSGPALILANHPHGIVDGLALATVVRRVRADVRLLVNRRLADIPELADFCFFVDPFEGSRAVFRSVAGLRAAKRWLSEGHVLVVFPSGEVAHRRNAGSYIESRWHDTGERLARVSNASIVFASIDGRNSNLFYAAGRVHSLLRTALLGHELLNKRGSTISVRFSGDLIDGEIEALPPESCLVSDTAFQVFCTTAHLIPNALREIGRLRAQAYHAVGEGTNGPIDLDRFDEQYLHLFVWDRQNRRIAGAYRIAETDRVTALHGVGGLYTRTLFAYDHQLLEHFGPALELGRSFVRLEYQRTRNVLFLLWKGIGTFIAKHPQYRVLFGPVSVSARYSDAARQQLIDALRRDRMDAALSTLVTGLNPPSEAAGCAEGLDVKHLEAPSLLRYYLNLNAQVLGFNVDPNFSNALDVLMAVELASVSTSARKRYLPTAA